MRRRDTAVRPEAVIAQLEEAVRLGTVDHAPAARVIEQLRAAPRDQPKDANGGRREHILQVAAQTFAKKGYRATSLQEIAHEVGVTRPSFYYHFRSKQEILAAILEVALARAEQAVDEAISGGGSATDKIRDFVLKYVEINTQHAEVPMLFQSVSELEPESGEVVRRRRGAIDHKLARLIADGVASGELVAASPLISAYGILGATNWMYTWYRKEGRLRPDEIAGLLGDLLLYGLAVRESPKPGD